MFRRLIVTTIVRYAKSGQDSGFLYEIDPDTGEALRRRPLPESPHRSRDSNPRGGLRGARGIAVLEDRLVLANAERLLVFDRDWKSRGEMTHPWFGGIHDLHADSEGVWVCCTNADLLAKTSWSGDIVSVWEWRRDAFLRAALGLRRVPPVDRDRDYRDPETMRSGVPNIVHLNGVPPAPDGGLLISFGRILSRARYHRARVAGWLGSAARTLGIPPRSVDHRRPSTLPVGRVAGSSSAIVHLSPDGSTEILARERDVAVPNHNVWREGGVLLYNDSNRGQLVAMDLKPPWHERRIKIPGNSPFVRGLARWSATCFLIGGHRPAAVHTVDLEQDAVIRTLPVSDDPAETIYAIQALPG